MSSLYNDFNPGPTGNIANLLSKFNQFSSTFSGNPEMRVKQMLQNGQMSQEQFNEIAQMANQLYRFIK
jgi:hypothetical protein